MLRPAGAGVTGGGGCKCWDTLSGAARVPDDAGHYNSNPEASSWHVWTLFAVSRQVQCQSGCRKSERLREQSRPTLADAIDVGHYEEQGGLRMKGTLQEVKTDDDLVITVV